MSGSREFRPQDTDIYRPYQDEMPWELLQLADPDEERVRGYLDADYTRVAKYDGEAVGVYVVRALTPTRFELCNLAVVPAFRHRGLGRWLLGHAIGLSETKGGREILVRNTPLKGLFERDGFVAAGDDLLLILTPEG
jgi:ribosomal protein S18 acetylase RimI-like enzyme